MSTHGKPPYATEQSLEHALGAVALKRLASMQAHEFVASLKKQGINSLEDLANRTLETARTVSAAGAFAADDGEIWGICYKFTTYRPHFDPGTINQVVSIVEKSIG
jgi:hypothetical protein